MNCEYVVNGDKPVIHFWIRQPDKKRKHLVVKNFEPYFYVPEKTKVKKDARIKKVEKGFTNIFGKKCKKITVDIPKSVAELRKQYSDHFEADILFPIRFLIDTEGKIEWENEPLRICYLDIEVSTPGEFPDYWTTKFPVVSLTIFDNYLSKYITFFLDKKIKGDKVLREKRVWKNRVRKKEKTPWDVYRFGDEQVLLTYFLKFIRETNPDILTGWNSNFFDIPYLIHRMQKLKLNPNLLSPIKSAYVPKPSMKLKTQKIEENPPIIKGRTCFDLLPHYRRLHITSLGSMALDNVAEEELGVKKLKYEGSIFDLYERDPEMLMKYNLADVELCVEIDKKREVIKFFYGLSKFIRCPLEDTLMNSRMADVYMLRTAKKQGIILPSKKPTVHFTIKGAIVLKPKTGLHKKVVVLDLKRIYPSIIASCNMSPETLDPKGEIQLGNGVRFSKKKAFLPQVLKTLFELRQEKEDKRNKYPINSELYKQYSRERQFVKDLVNSIYGMMLYEGFRLYTPKVGESVTWTGRNLLRWTKKKITKLGYEVLYGDTDSIFVKIGNKNLDDAIKIGRELEEKVNKSYDDFAALFNIEPEKHVFKIEFEKYFSALIIGKKKKYAGKTLWINGKKDVTTLVTGFEAKRSDTPAFTRKLQRELLDMILEGKSKIAILKFLNKKMEEIKTLPIEEIGIPKGIQKDIDKYLVDSAHIRGCKYSNAFLGTHFNKGSKPKMIYIKKTPPKYPRTDVLCFDYQRQVPEGFEVDWDKMTTRLVKQKVKTIFEALDWTWADMDLKQKKLNQFFGVAK